MSIFKTPTQLSLDNNKVKKHGSVEHTISEIIKAMKSFTDEKNDIILVHKKYISTNDCNYIENQLKSANWDIKTVMVQYFTWTEIDAVFWLIKSPTKERILKQDIANALDASTVYQWKVL